MKLNNLFCKKLFSFSILILFWFNSYSQSADIEITNYSDADGLSSNSVSCLAQDSKGFIWLGTEDGLNRFDGYHFKIFRRIPGDSTSLSCSVIERIFIDQHDNIWIKNRNKTINLFSISTEKTEQFDSIITPYNIPNKKINSIYIDLKNTLWINSYDSILYEINLNDNQPQVNRLIIKNRNELAASLQKITRDKNNVVWISDNRNQLLYSYTNSNNQIIGFKNFDLNKITTDTAGYLIYSILQDEFERYWINTNRDLVLFHPQAGVIKRWNGNYNYSYNINALILNGRYWLTGYDAIYSIDLTTLNEIKYINEPRNNSGLHFHSGQSQHIITDTQGLIWTGTTTGLTKINPSAKKFYCSRLENNISIVTDQNRIRRIVSNDSDLVFLGTDVMNLYQYNRTTHEYSKLYESYFNKLNFRVPIWGLLWGKNNLLWVSLHNNGIMIYDAKNKKYNHLKNEIGNKNSILGFDFRGLAQDNDGITWASSETGISRINLDNNTINSINLQEETKKYPHSLLPIRSIAIEKNNNLWIGTGSQGFYHFKYQGENTPPEIQQYLINYSVISSTDNWVNTICIASTGLLWLGTYGGGLVRFNPKLKSIKIYSANNGLINDVVYGIEEDDHGNLWMSTNKGICKFNPTTEKFVTYDVNDGLQGNEYNSGAVYKNLKGELFFGGTNGWNCFHPDSIKTNTYEPSVVFTDFQILNKSVVITENSFLKKNINYLNEIILQPDQATFSFEFAALNYLHSAKNVYRYLLEGYDRNWQYIGTRRFITFTNLNPGKYLLKIQGSNNDGVWSSHIKTLRIIILPKYYQTWWFRLLIILMIIAATTAVIYASFRFRKIKKAEQLKIREQLKKDLHDDLKSDIAAIQTNADLVVRGIDKMDKAKVKSKANEISELTQTAMSTVDDLSWSFNPEADYADELFVKMKNFVVAILPDEIHYIIDAPIEKTNLILPFRTRKHFYLIFKECIYNLKKHSQCKNVLIRWSISERKISLQIHDDGIGFNLNDLKRKNGLNHLADRAKEIGANLKISATPGNGTSIFLEVSTT